MIENQTKSNSTTQSLEILGLNRTQSQNTTQSFEIMEDNLKKIENTTKSIEESKFLMIDQSQQILGLSRSSSIASPIRVKPEKEISQEQFNEISSFKLEELKFESPLEKQIQNISFDKTMLERLIEQLGKIENIKQILKKYDIKQKIKEIENFEKEVINQCAEWEIIPKQRSLLAKYFQKNDQQKLHKDKMINHIANFYSYLYNFLQDQNDFTSSQFQNNNGFFQAGDLNLTLKFTLHTQYKKSQPIDIDIHHTLFNQKYQLFLTEVALLQKLEEKIINNKLNDQLFWLDEVRKLSKSKKNHVLIDYEFHRETKQITIYPQNYKPFIITEDSSPLYLGQQMKLALDKNLQINVQYADFTSEAQSQKFCLLQHEKITSIMIKDNSKDLIKLEYTKQQQNNKLQKNCEFLLRDQQLELNPYLPLFQGVLQHDLNGFIIIPHKNQRLKLYTDQPLVTKQRNMSFSLELNDDVWIEVEYDLAKAFVFD